MPHSSRTTHRAHYNHVHHAHRPRSLLGRVLTRMLNRVKTLFQVRLALRRARRHRPFLKTMPVPSRLPKH